MTVLQVSDGGSFFAHFLLFHSSTVHSFHMTISFVESLNSDLWTLQPHTAPNSRMKQSCVYRKQTAEQKPVCSMFAPSSLSQKHSVSLDPSVTQFDIRLYFCSNKEIPTELLSVGCSVSFWKGPDRWPGPSADHLSGRVAVRYESDTMCCILLRTHL